MTYIVWWLKRGLSSAQFASALQDVFAKSGGGG
jgi:hypothetical protein